MYVRPELTLRSAQGFFVSLTAETYYKKGGTAMADNKKMVEEITSMDVDFAQWYTDIVKKAELIDYTSVKGCMVS